MRFQADVTLFAHTAAIYYTPYKHEIKEMLENDFPRIKRHMDRMKALYYRDEVLEN